MCYLQSNELSLFLFCLYLKNQEVDLDVLSKIRFQFNVLLIDSVPRLFKIFCVRRNTFLLFHKFHRREQKMRPV